MDKRYIQSFRCRFLDPEHENDQIREIASSLPRRASRRMSKLGILLNSVIEQPLDLGTTLIYGTTYTESNALETFLDSLPYASPTAFQTSIHPGGVQQALILGQQPVGPFFPIAGDQDIILQMLKTAFVSTTPRTLICGGEEQGGWLREFDLAYPLSFAFSMLLSDDPQDCIGSIRWDREAAQNAGTSAGTEACVRLWQSGQRTRLGGEEHGQFDIVWK